MPRLIDDETFQKVQAKLEANKRGGKGAAKKIHPELAIEDYWLSGKLYCGICGATLQGVSGTSKTGGLYYYYSCGNYRKHKCELKYQRKTPLEKIVAHTLDDLTRDPALRILIANKCYAYHLSQNDDNGAYEESIKVKLKDIEGKLANIMKALEAGIFNDTIAERMNDLENQKRMLSDALLAEQNRRKYSITLADIIKYLNGIIGDVNEPDTRKRMLELFVDKIYVYPDKLVMTFYYSDERREIPFAETARLIENQERISDMLNGQYDSANVSVDVLNSLIGNEEETPDFFP